MSTLANIVNENIFQFLKFKVALSNLKIQLFIKFYDKIDQYRYNTMKNIEMIIISQIYYTIKEYSVKAMSLRERSRCSKTLLTRYL